MVVSKIWSNKGLSQAKVGDDMQKGSPFVAVANLDAILIRTEIEEQFLSFLKPGILCTVSVPSMPGKAFDAKLKSIGVLARERKGRDSTEGLSKVFELEIVPVKSQNTLQPGTSVDVKIPLKKLKQVLTLPKHAFYKRGPKNYVLLKDGSERLVKLGELNPKEGVVLEGLEPGEEVQIPKTNKDNAQ